VSNFVISNGQIPRLVIITFLEATTFHGNYKRNPYNFTLKNCLSAQLSVNGRPVPPLQYTPKTSMLEPYLASLRIVSKLYSDSDTGVTFDDFLQSGYQVLPFDLFPLDAGIPAKANGVVTFTGQWSSLSFDEHHIMLYYLLFDSTISIDERKNIILDFIP